MKFGKHLQKRQLDIPEYAASFVNYKALKKLIKQLAGGTKPSESAKHGLGHPQAVLQANKATFFFRLDREVEKVNAFYLHKEEELNLRLRTLLENKKIMQLRAGSASETPATFVTLQEGFQRFGSDLNKLLQFIELNAMAFSKILKKWDKFSKSRTKELYLSRAVEVQPCFNRDVISELSDQATTNSLELEAWGDGENLFATKIHEQRSNEPNKPRGVRNHHDSDGELLRIMINGDGNQLQDALSSAASNPHFAESFSRIFLSSIHDAPDENLSILIDSHLIDLHFRDEINQRNCLHEAAISGKMLLLRAALAKGVKLDVKDVYGRLPVHYASMHGHVDIADVLLTCLPDTVDSVDHDNFTPLIHAIHRQQLSCVNLLLARNARIDPVNDQDYIPLNFACQHGLMSIAEMLLSKHAKILADAEGLYPQHLVARHGHDPKIFLLLKSYGADINEVDRLNQWTALFHAASEGNIECLRALIECGANAEILDENGRSAMYYSVWEGKLDCAQVLHAAGGALGLAQTHVSADSQLPPSSGSAVVMNLDSDGIPDLSLPPPILPLRRYGHNFLDNKIFVQLSFEEQNNDAVYFFHDGKYPASRLTISSKSSDLIPRNLLLPLTEDARRVTFQIDSLESFSVDFDVFPTFGTKMIARAVALSQIFNTADTSGNCILPLFDSRTRAIGRLSFDFQTVKPFLGVPMEITHFATYWKATSQYDSHPLITGSSLSGEYVRIFVQVTRDLIPVIFPSWIISFEGVDIPICAITLQEFERIVSRIASLSRSTFTSSVNAFSSLEELHSILKSSFFTLKDLLDTLNPSVHLDINILGQSPENERFNTRPGLELNSYIDSILSVVFDHSQQQRQNSTDLVRSIMFSAEHPSICTAVNWKQPTFPVFFCNSLGAYPPSVSDGATVSWRPEACDSTSISIKEAVRFAKNNNLMGLICSSRILDMVPALIQSIKVEGLVLVASITDSSENSRLIPALDGILRPGGVLEFNETIDI